MNSTLIWTMKLRSARWKSTRCHSCRSLYRWCLLRLPRRSHHGPTEVSKMSSVSESHMFPVCSLNYPVGVLCTPGDPSLLYHKFKKIGQGYVTSSSGNMIVAVRPASVVHPEVFILLSTSVLRRSWLSSRWTWISSQRKSLL